LNATQNVTSKAFPRAKEKTTEEPKDIAVIVSNSETEPVFELLDRDIKSLKKDMKKEGFVFNDKGLAPAIIYPSCETKLIAGQEVVARYFGEITATLWQVEAFTANIPPEAYHFFSRHETEYKVLPDTEFRTLKKPKMKFGLIALCESLDNMQ
ncbi:MAG: hypothetical protein ABRQ39_30525, partial [Candidatus Eremiobacterota bacterium]